jgi:hypothetical protein
MSGVETSAPSRAEVAKTALALLDDWGTAALSFDTIALELGCDPSDVADLVGDELHLLDLACDQVYSEVDLRPVDLVWHRRLEIYANSFREALLRHPNAAVLVATRPILSEASMALAERSLNELTSVGFQPVEANRLLIVIASFVLGHVLTEIGGETDPGEHDPAEVDEFRAHLPTDTLPLTAQALAEKNNRNEEFKLGLKLLIDGLERRMLHQ